MRTNTTRTSKTTMNDTEIDWFETYQRYEAIWTHGGTGPHALMSGGEHSSGFFNSERVMEDPLILHDACRQLITSLAGLGVRLDAIDRVIGPAMGAITIAHTLAFWINTLRPAGPGTHGVTGRCLRSYAERENADKDSPMAFKKTEVKEGEIVLLAEDVMTRVKGGTVSRTAEAVTRKGGIILPYVAVLVNRTGESLIEGRQVISLIERSMPKWDPAKETCPLCAQGSEALRPKEVGNWARLNLRA